MLGAAFINCWSKNNKIKSYPPPPPKLIKGTSNVYYPEPIHSTTLCTQYIGRADSKPPPACPLRRGQCFQLHLERSPLGLKNLDQSLDCPLKTTGQAACAQTSNFRHIAPTVPQMAHQPSLQAARLTRRPGVPWDWRGDVGEWLWPGTVLHPNKSLKVHWLPQIGAQTEISRHCHQFH